VLLERGVVDEDVELAELLHHLRNRPLAEGAVLDGARNEDGAMTFGFDVLQGALSVRERSDGFTIEPPRKAETVPRLEIAQRRFGARALTPLRGAKPAGLIAAV
jgi:hypothetical protein